MSNTHEQLRAANDQFEKVRAIVAKIGATMGVKVDASDSRGATSGHVVNDLARIADHLALPPEPAPAELHRLLNDLAWATSHEQGAPAARRAVEEYFMREVSRG